MSLDKILDADIGPALLTLGKWTFSVMAAAVIAWMGVKHDIQDLQKNKADVSQVASVMTDVAVVKETVRTIDKRTDRMERKLDDALDIRHPEDDK